MVPLAAFLRAGRFMVTVITPSSRSTIRVLSWLDITAAYENPIDSALPSMPALRPVGGAPVDGRDPVDGTSLRTRSR